MNLYQGELKSFNAGSYIATVRLTASYKAYLEGVAVARNIPGAEMVSGRKVVLIFFDENNTREAVVIAVYT